VGLHWTHRPNPKPCVKPYWTKGIYRRAAGWGPVRQLTRESDVGAPRRVASAAATLEPSASAGAAPCSQAAGPLQGLVAVGASRERRGYSRHRF
jgi:hypothetical protein